MSTDVRKPAPAVRRSIKSLFGTDAQKEQDGIVIQFGETLKVKLARAGGANEKFMTVTEEKTRPFRRMIDAELLPREMDRQLTREIFAEAVVLGWEGNFDDDTGEEIPFSVDECKREMEENPDFLSFVVTESRRLANFRKAELAAASGN